jgi:hypothetical protein
VRGRYQAVEEVIVNPVGGPKVARNKAKTLRNGVFQPLNRALKGARSSLSTRWDVLGSSLGKPQNTDSLRDVSDAMA